MPLHGERTRIPDLSVVIPTYNGGWILHRTVDALRQQDAPKERFEIIVVDDGSTDGSTDGVDDAGPPAVRVVRQDNQGRSIARNRGTAEARGAILLFLDADVWATPELVSAHLARHDGRSNLGVQGRYIPHPDSLTSVFMRATNLLPDMTIRRREGLSPYHVITRNFSVDRDAFDRAGGFDEKFTGYGWEDMELALRLVRAGASLCYEPAATAHHFHMQTLPEVRDKFRQAGEGAVYFWKKHGKTRELGLFLEIAPALLPLKWLVYRTNLITRPVEAVLPWAEKRALLPICSECYNHLIWKSYYQGVFAALRHGIHSQE